jgi:hypothetical protein
MYARASVSTTVTLLAVVAACGGAPLPRETTASNTRTDDRWLDWADACPAAVDAGFPSFAGLRTETIETGTGRALGDGETVRIHYVASLPDGTVVHDTRAGGTAPIEVVIGRTKIICGLQKALDGMRAGEQRRVTVPWKLAFGEAGKPPSVPPRTDLAFVVDLYVPAMGGPESGSAPVRPPSGRGGGAGRGGGR